VTLMRDIGDFAKFKQRGYGSGYVYEFENRGSRVIRERVQRYKTRAEIRLEIALWKPIDKEMTYEEILKGLTWNELATVRNNVRLKGISHLGKDELGKAISIYMPQSINDLVTVFNEEQRDYLNDIITNKGLITELKSSEHKMLFWRDRALVFSGTVNGEKALYIPEEIIECISDSINNEDTRERIRKNQKWINTVNSLLSYFGIISKVELIKMMQKYTDFKKEEEATLLEVLKENASYSDNFKFLGSSLLHIRLKNISGIRGLARDYIRLEHKPLSEEAINNAFKDEHYTTRDEVKEFILFLLEEYDYSYSEAVYEILDFIYAIKNLIDIGEIVNYLSHVLEWKSSEHYVRIIEMLSYLQQNVELWHLKGYSIKEYNSLRNNF